MLSCSMKRGWTFTTTSGDVSSYGYHLLDDVAAVVASFATTTSAFDKSGVALTGAIGGTAFLPARTVTVTLSSTVGAFVLNSVITVTGKRNGETVTEELTVTSANGGVVLRGTQAFEQITRVQGEAQADTDGTISVGLGDVVAPLGGEFLGYRAGHDGRVLIQFGDGSKEPYPCTDGESMFLEFDRLLVSGTGATAGKVTVFI